MNVRTLIVDDEPLSRRRLVSLLGHYPQIEVVGEAGSGPEAQALLERQDAQLVFLDIDMPGPNGLETARQMQQLADPPLVVFVTAHPEHALEAFSVAASDYLLKPVESERLKETVTRLMRQVEEPAWTPPPAPRACPRLVMRDKDQGLREMLDATEVLWFEAREGKTFARVGQRFLESTQSLAQLEPVLPAEAFVRTSRAHLVNLARIKRVIPWFNGSYNLQMEGGAEVPLSRSFVADFQKRVHWL